MSEGECTECQGTGYIITPACCKQNLVNGECQSHCAIPEQEPCPACGGEGFFKED